MSGGDRFLYVLGALIPGMILAAPFVWFATITLGDGPAAVIGWVLYPAMIYAVYVFSSRRWPPETNP